MSFRLAKAQTVQPALLWLYVMVEHPKKLYLRPHRRLKTGYIVIPPVCDAFQGSANRLCNSGPAATPAPPWRQIAEVEWLFRLLVEPRRLFKRHAVTHSIFAVLVLREPCRRFRYT